MPNSKTYFVTSSTYNGTLSARTAIDSSKLGASCWLLATCLIMAKLSCRLSARSFRIVRPPRLLVPSTSFVRNAISLLGASASSCISGRLVSTSKTGSASACMKSIAFVRRSAVDGSTQCTSSKMTSIGCLLQMLFSCAVKTFTISSVNSAPVSVPSAADPAKSKQDHKGLDGFIARNPPRPSKMLDSLQVLAGRVVSLDP